MQEKIQHFIALKKEELARAAEAEKRQRLIRLGLTEEPTRQYSDNAFRSEAYPEYDEKSGKFYRTIPVPLEVTDEEYAEICKYDTPPAETRADAGVRSRAVSTVRTIAMIWLIAGIAASVFLLIDALVEGAFWGIANALLLLLGVILSRALALVFCEIAESLHRIERHAQK